MSNIFIISGPSGAGEDSVIKGLKRLYDLEKIITTTTRAMRPGEVHGVDYYFVNHEQFREMIDNGEFAEWAEEDNGQLYGGSIQEIERVRECGKLAIWKIEYKGVITVKKRFPDIKSIFIHIPIEKVRERLEMRGIHDEAFIEARIDYARGWYENESVFDFKVDNIDGKLDNTIDIVANIIKENWKRPS